MTDGPNQARTEAKREEIRQATLPEGYCEKCGRVSILHDSCEPCPFCEVERLNTWAGLMSLLDTHYPPDLVDGSSGDPGPRTIVLIREVDRLKALLTTHKEKIAVSGFQVADLKEIVADHERENERLQAIVDKLPTCWRLVGEGDDRRLVQDVVVVPGMNVWWWDTRYAIWQDVIERVSGSWAWGDSQGFEGHEIYDSPEAAKFAAEAAKGDA